MKEAAKMMDAGAREGEPGTITHHERECWALKTLVAEFRNLFPETAYEAGGRDGRGVALDVTFDLTVLDADVRMHATDLLRLTRGDERVAEVLEDDEQVLVQFISNAHSQDDRASFGLDGAWSILVGDDES